MAMNLSKFLELVEDIWTAVLQSMGSQRVRHNLETEQQQQHTGHFIEAPSGLLQLTML